MMPAAGVGFCYYSLCLKDFCGLKSIGYALFVLGGLHFPAQVLGTLKHIWKFRI
jgi:hypothetical protein